MLDLDQEVGVGLVGVILVAKRDYQNRWLEISLLALLLLVLLLILLVLLLV